MPPETVLRQSNLDLQKVLVTSVVYVCWSQVITYAFLQKKLPARWPDDCCAEYQCSASGSKGFLVQVGATIVLVSHANIITNTPPETNMTVKK